MDDRIASALELSFPDRTAEAVGSAGISWN
ncbi:phosphotransferase, partial [Haloferax mucosum ATCC BAA-1512]